jgi:alkaline phosphatase
VRSSPAPEWSPINQHKYYFLLYQLILLLGSIMVLKLSQQGNLTLELNPLIMRIKLIIILSLCINSYTFAQSVHYTTANAHSHNNYAQPAIFWNAYNQQYGSIEADVLLLADGSNLWVGHGLEDLKLANKSLDTLYLVPLVNCIRKSNGYVYADHSRKLQLMIDIKTKAEPSLKKLIALIEKYPELVNTPSLKFVISGNRPNPATFTDYPSFIWFDGETDSSYSESAFAKVAMMSAPLTKYSKWDGKQPMPENEQQVVSALIKKVHELKRPIRFWAAPDSMDAWKLLMQLGVDYINTDRIDELAQFLK